MTLFLVALLTSLYLAAAVFWFGKRRPGYSQLRQTISELGESGARDAQPVAYLLFLPVGLACAGLGYWLSAGFSAFDKPVSLLAVALAVGYLGAVFFPCDPGSPLNGSWRQGLHNLAGGFEYIISALALWRLSATGGLFFGGASLLVGLALIGLSVEALFPWRGLIQRVAEAAMFASLCLALWPF